LSWIGRVEQEAKDADVRFVLLWTGFNSAYAGGPAAEINNERGAFKAYFDALVALDGAHRIYTAVWERFPHEIRLLLANKYIFAPFWNHQNGFGRVRRLGRAAPRQQSVCRYGYGPARHPKDPVGGFRSAIRFAESTHPRRRDLE
jgi:hypothetical protein